MGVDHAALNTMLRDDEFALKGSGRRNGDGGFHRFTGKTRAEDIAPVNVETAIGGAERGKRHAFLRQRRNPCGIGAETRPACAAERQKNGIGLDGDLALRCRENQVLTGKTRPAMPRPDGHPLRLQPGKPCPQQRRGLHDGGKDPARGADERFLPQPLRPIAQHIRRKIIESGAQPRFRIAEPVTEAVVIFGMGDVEAGFSGHQQFTRHGRHRLEHRHGMACGRKHLGRHQPRRSAADNRDLPRLAQNPLHRHLRHCEPYTDFRMRIYAILKRPCSRSTAPSPFRRISRKAASSPLPRR